MSQTVIINIGVSGSGKTTWTTSQVRVHPNYLRINRDDIRTVIKGTLDEYYTRKNLGKLEEFVSETENQMFITALLRGFDVIVDNTNLKPSYIKNWLELVQTFENINSDGKKVDVKFKLFREDNAHRLKQRVNVRDAPLGWDKLNYIDKQLESLKNIISYVERNYKDKILYE